MVRRGQCRCGNILQFRKSAVGYKTRCKRCQAVVRLRVPTRTSQASPPPLPVPPVSVSTPTPMPDVAPLEVPVMTTLDLNLPFIEVELDPSMATREHPGKRQS